MSLLREVKQVRGVIQHAGIAVERTKRRRSFSAFRVATSRCNAASWKRAASPCPGSPSPALLNAKAALAVNIGFISPTVYELWRARDW